MRADTQLDYAVFQLTPTRTRCELHIVANGLTYKLASGLLKPFVSHLRAAEEQLAKGGYSIRLEPPDSNRGAWFTKGTMERFVRFVSTPEVLERVSSVEVELVELEETTRQQNVDTNDGSGPGQLDSSHSKNPLSQLSTGGKSAGAAAFDQGMENGSEESSKHRLLRALDARSMMLQKEQGMAFARALAAGFKLEYMDDLVLFAECFGANRLREACVKFMALCKKRQESGLGLEDLELMAAENAHADILYMGGNAVGLVWPHSQANGRELPHSPSASNEGKQATSEDTTENFPGELIGRGSLDEVSKEQWQMAPPLRPATTGGGDGLPSVVKGHPMMATWQAQPHNQWRPPYAAMHPGMPNHYDPSTGFTGPVRPGLSFPHYYMSASYPDGNGWQAHPPGPPYWHGSQVSNPIDGGYHRSPHQHAMSTPSSREKEVNESHRYEGDVMHDNGKDYGNELFTDLSGRFARQSTSPRRRSASPSRKVQTGRTGGSKRSGMVVIRNINYITPIAQQQDNRDDNSGDSDSWSEEEDSLRSDTETLRASIDDAVGVAGGANCATKDWKRRHLKRDRKKAGTKGSAHEGDNSDDGDDAELDDIESNKLASEQKDFVWVLNRNDNKAFQISNSLSDEGLFSDNGVTREGAFGPALESASLEKEDVVHSKANQLAEDAVLLSHCYGNYKAAEAISFDLFEQEQRQESEKVPVMDDSYIIAGGEMTAMGKSRVIMEPDLDFNSQIINYSQVGKTFPDDSFIVLDKSATRDGYNGNWRRSLSLETEMPLEQNHDGRNSAVEPGSFEPDDMFMVPDRGRDTYRGAWDSPLDYGMQVLAADLIDIRKQGENKEVVEEVDESDMQGHDLEETHTALVPKKVSERDAKAKPTKEMVERRKSVGGGRPGRPNPLAEAQLRAEKLRLYKAGLQKSKKEKEEEERKRIEHLKIQRQQRIAARSNPSGGSPSSPSLVRGTRTFPPVSKSSPKVLNKVLSSPLSSTVNRERLTHASRVARNALESPKSTDSPLIRSVSSVTELLREAKKSTSLVRASTGSQLSSLCVKNERIAEPNTHRKPNGHVEEKVSRAKSVRTDGKARCTGSGLAENFARSESRRIDEKLGRAASVYADGLSESSGISEKTLPIATRTMRRSPPLDGPASHVKSPQSPTTDSKVAKMTSTVPSLPVVQKKSALAPKAYVEKVKIESTPSPLPLSLKEQPKVEKSERLMKVFEGKDSCPVETEKSLCHENGNGHMEGLSRTSMVARINDYSAEKNSQDNRFSISSATMTLVENSKEEALPFSRAPAQLGAEERQLEVEASLSVGEECHVQVAHVSHSVDTHDICTSQGHLVGEYSPPFPPPLEYAMSPTVNPALISPTSPQEFTMESSPNGVSSTRSRKKWGDSKAKGLKRLLLLGRKTGHSSTPSAVDISSDGEEEELPSSNGKKLINDLDNYNDQAAGSVPLHVDLGSGNSSKGSQSIFSLSTFRGNKSAVKA